jgi:primosomal protein N' (replication factor Y)
MHTLFPEAHPLRPAGAGPGPRADAPSGPFAVVALEQGIARVLDYALPPRLVPLVQVGQRVRVPLGKRNRPAHGYVVSVKETTQHPSVKKLFEIEDERVLINPALMELARWMSRYYCAPLGTVLETVIPAAVKKKVGVGYAQMVRPLPGRDALHALFEKTRAPKRRAILARLLLIEEGASVELNRLAGEAGATVPTVRKLVRLGLIAITPQVDLPSLAADVVAPGGGEAELALNEDQQKVFDELRPRVAAGGFSVNLLMGVTGSGKTEVYLRCIREAVERRRRAIVLVPEIALTPQTVRRFTARFKGVAILHSGLTATERHRYWQMISTGHAQVVVGARSAIFAPVPDLGVIVVDEEHEASYKQDQIPRYHARDVAIKRGQLEDVPVLLGSATPSLETYWRVADSEARRHGGTQARRASDVAGGPAALRASVADAFVPPLSHLLTLPRRVRGLSMPHVELVDMKVENRFRRGVHLLSQRLEHLLKTTLEAGHQAILLLNRRGYSNFVYCSSCTNAIQCRYCDATMTYHRMAGAHAKGATLAEGVHTGQLHCHYCLAVNALPDKCPVCSKKLSLFGLGTQRVEEELRSKFPDLTFARVDSDSMRGSKDYEALLGRFARKEVQVMLGTQMIAKGLDYPNVTLVGVISGDTALALPDFRAAERTFQLITQVAGRAGRGDSSGRVVLQTFLPDDPAIQAAIRQDFVGFARFELAHRREVGLPPFARMVRIVLRDEEQQRLHRRSEDLAALLNEAIAREGGAVQIKGPMPCAISRIAGNYRNQVVMTAATPAPLQRVLAAVRDKGGLTKGEKVAVDVDPVSLL